MDSVLIILTNKYPYGNGETYVETERRYWDKFDRVYICPVLVRKNETIREGFTAKPYETVVSTIDGKPGLFASLGALFGSISIRDYWRELKTLKRSGRLSAANIKLLVFMGILSNLRIKRIEKALRQLLPGSAQQEKRLLYSYWLYEPAIVGTGLKKRLGCVRMISRVHGYDLYDERHQTGYIPFRDRVFQIADRVYSISEKGRKYLSERHGGQYDEKISVSRLGTVRKFGVNSDGRGEETVIVSCSDLIPLKRVGMIADALMRCDKPVSWFHFGDGELRAGLEERCRALPDNVKARFMGFTPNDGIQKFYSENHIDAFLNVSESEGIPVSIMEAQSYGLPVIATDVGGTRELVHNGENGVLLKIDFSGDELISAIDDVVEKGQRYRDNAVKTWETLSDSKKICDEFFDREAAFLKQ